VIDIIREPLDGPEHPLDTASDPTTNPSDPTPRLQKDAIVTDLNPQSSAHSPPGVKGLHSTQRDETW
jgi:hypothetical protein